jgi:S-adenosylmethionine:tRNA ribosyltransferase-isomerase
MDRPLPLDDFDFDLPPERIAQRPATHREQARLMALDKRRERLGHHRVADLPELLRGDEIVVVNDTRVVPARLLLDKPTGGRVELLVLPTSPGSPMRERVAMYRSSRPLVAGTELALGEGHGHIEVLEVLGGGRVRVEFHSEEPVEIVLDRHGHIPLPPYIARDPSHGPDAQDRQRYQTLFAAHPGAVAAPTAGLHFSAELLARVEAVGVPVVQITLHVGAGTFQPVRVADLREHSVEEEHYAISAETAERIAAARREGRRVLAVGTTTVRTLESAAAEGRTVRAGSGTAALTIVPGYDFRVVDALMTNFHLPRSSLLALVCAFAGREQVLRAYQEAIAEEYRFYSYGDAMLIQ